MSTIAVTNLKHESASGNNITLASDGTAAFAEIISANKGVKFPGTAVASADPNTLDDYEEGTWTVTDQSVAGLSITNNVTATYTKIGRLVFVNFYITYPSTADSNGAKINLPFTSGAGYSMFTGRFQGSANSGTTGFVVQTSAGEATANFQASTNSFSSYQNAQLSGSYLLISGCYITA